MEGFKKFLIYSIILLCIATVTLFAMASYLILIPNSNVFGYSYTNVSGITRFDTIAQDFVSNTEFDEIIVNTKRADVKVTMSDSAIADIIFFADVRISGYYFNVASPNVTYEIIDNEGSKDLEIIIVEPQGLLFINNVEIEIVLSQKYTYNSIEFTSEKGDITVAPTLSYLLPTQ